MNINANDLILLNRINLRYKKEDSQEEQVLTTKPTTVETDSTMEYLNLKAKNNIAFQGVNMPAVKKAALKTMIALATLGGAAALTSCEPVNIEQTVNIDFSEITQMFSEMQRLFNMMLEQQKISNETNAAMLSYMQQLLEEVKNGNLSANEFYQNMYEYMTSNKDMQQAILNQLIENGKTQEEANAYIESILKAVEDGNMTFEEAVSKLMEILGSIDGKLDTIINKLDTISQNIVNFHNEYTAGKDSALVLLGGIYENGKYNSEQLDKLVELQNKMNINLEVVKNNTDSLLAISQDSTKYAELIDAIKNNQINYEKFEEMFKVYGLSIEQVVQMSAKDLEATLKTFMETYVKTEEEQTELLEKIYDKFGNVSGYPGLGSQELIDALEELTNAVNNNTQNVTAELKDIEAALAKIQETLDNLYKEVGKLSNDVSTYNQIFEGKWNETLNKLDGFTGDITEIKNAQLQSNRYLEALLEKVDALKAELEKLAQAGNEGMTIDEFKAYMQERDNNNYLKFVQLMIDMGLDKLAGDVASIKDLLGALNDKVQQQKDYSAQLDTIIALLEGVDFKTGANSTKLDEVINLLKNFKCNCNCNSGSGSNEGIVDDLEDMFG